MEAARTTSPGCAFAEEIAVALGLAEADIRAIAGVGEDNA